MKNNQKKYKFNIIDVLIILVVIAIVVVMYYYTSARNSIVSNSEVEIDYVVELKLVHKDYIDNIAVGDSVVETVRDQQIGEVIAVDVSPSHNIVTNTLTGETYKSYYPAINEPDDETQPEYEYYNVRVTVRDKVKKSDMGYRINEFEISVGQNVYFRVPHYVGEGYCVSITETSK